MVILSGHKGQNSGVHKSYEYVCWCALSCQDHMDAALAVCKYVWLTACALTQLLHIHLARSSLQAMAEHMASCDISYNTLCFDNNQAACKQYQHAHAQDATKNQIHASAVSKIYLNARSTYSTCEACILGTSDNVHSNNAT